MSSPNIKIAFLVEQTVASLKFTMHRNRHSCTHVLTTSARESAQACVAGPCACSKQAQAVLHAVCACQVALRPVYCSQEIN